MDITQRKDVLRLSLIYLLVCAVKLPFTLLIKMPFVWGDAYLYTNRAFNLATKGIPAIYNHFGPDYPPLYSVAIAPAFLFSSDPDVSHHLILALNVLVINSIVFPAYFLIRNLSVSHLHSIFATTLLLFLPTTFGYANSVLAENLYYPLLFWCFYFVARCSRSFSIRSGLLLGLMAGFLILTKSIGYTFYASTLVLAFFGILVYDWSKRLQYILLITVGTVLPLLIWQVVSNLALPQDPVQFAADYPTGEYFETLWKSLHELDTMSLFVRLFMNQTSYLIAASFGFVFPLIFWIGRNLTKNSENKTLVLGVLTYSGAMTLLSVLHSTLQFELSPQRYVLMPRYLDSAIALIVLVGVVQVLGDWKPYGRAWFLFCVSFGFLLALQVPCLSFGIIDRMSMSYLQPFLSSAPCRFLLVGTLLLLVSLIHVSRFLVTRTLLICSVILLSLAGNITIIKAQRSLGNYHRQSVKLAKDLGEAIEDEEYLVFDIALSHSNPREFLSFFWKMLYETQKRAEFITSLAALDERSPDDLMVLVQYQCSPSEYVIARHSDACVQKGTAGELKVALAEAPQE